MKGQKGWLGSTVQVCQSQECCSMLAMTSVGKKLCLLFGRILLIGLTTVTSTNRRKVSWKKIISFSMEECWGWMKGSKFLNMNLRRRSFKKEAGRGSSRVTRWIWFKEYNNNEWSLWYNFKTLYIWFFVYFWGSWQFIVIYVLESSEDLS